jgi:hypothetical protein
MNRPVRYLFASLFALIFVTLIFQEVAEPEWVKTFEILIMALLFGGIGFSVYGYHEYGFDGRFVILLFTYLLCLLVLIGVLFQQRGTGFPDPGRAAKLTFIVLLLLFFLGISIKQRTYLRKTSVFLLAFAVLFSIYVYHVVGLHPDTGSAAFPLLAGFMMGLTLFVLPRYVSSDAFLWTVGLVACVTVLIGLPAYDIGNYTFFGMEVALYGAAFSPLFMNEQIPVLQSVFVNPNTFGVVMFAGTASAGILIHRLFPDTSSDNESRQMRADGASASVLSYPFVFSLGLSCLAGGVFVINAIGLYLSHSRACYLAAAVSLVLYFSYVVLGRRSLPYALGGLVGVVALFLILLPVIGINPSGRFTLWGGGVTYLYKNVSLLGEGIVATGDLIKPYVAKPYRGQAPHNSYLSTFIRAGLLGGAAYLFIIAGSLIVGVVRYQQVNVPALALAFGFAIHQMFESYSLFQHGILAMIASLSFGFLILSGFLTEDSEEPADRHEMRRRTRSWSRTEWKQ